MICWGLSYGHHDAAAVVLNTDRRYGVMHAKRFYSKDITSGDLATLRDTYGMPDRIYVHENKWRDAWRKIKIGDWSRLIPRKMFFPVKPIVGNHHLSHAAAAFYTSPFQDALVIVADAIGELESLAVYRAYTGKLNTKPIYTLKYPHSLGLFYSYHTALIGLQPNKDENKLMMLSKQSRFYDYDEVLDTIEMSHSSDYNVYFKCNKNLHKYPKEIVTDPTAQKWIASTAQNVVESYILQLITKYTKDIPETNIVFSGGVAYNTLLCNKIASKFNNFKLYVPSHPGDAGSAYGAILQHTHKHVKLHNGAMYAEEKIR